MNSNEKNETMQQQIKSGGQINSMDFEKIEENFKPKYPNSMHISNEHLSFVQKRLQKGTKFFDSGDYQMEKQRPRGYKPTFGSTGDAIPTPETVSVRKSYHTFAADRNPFPNIHY